MKPAKPNESALQFNSLMKASFLYEAAIHPMRQQLLSILTEEKRLSAKAMADILFLEEETCIQQLSILCGAGLLFRQPDAGEVYYTVDSEKLQQLYDCAEALLQL